MHCRAPPTYMLDVGKQTGQFFDAIYDVYGTKTYRFKSLEQYSAEHNTNEQPSKRYFNANTLPDIINTYPMAKKDAKPADVERGSRSITSIRVMVGIHLINILNRDEHAAILH